MHVELTYETQQLFRELLFGNVGVLLRLPFFGWFSVLMHCDEVNAYDFKCDFTDGGNGNVSIAYTDVRRTIVRQHNSCNDNTIKMRFERDKKK